MKRNKKILCGATLALVAAMSLGAAALGASASVGGYTDFIREDFNTGVLSSDVWQTPAEGITLINVEPSINYRIYHQKSVSTKEEVTVADTDVLVVEYDLKSIDVEGGYWGVTYGAESTDLTLENAICFYGTSQMFFGGNEVNNFVYNADLTSTRWVAWSRDAVTRVVIYPDGAQKLYQDGALVAQVKAEDVGETQRDRNGYMGIAFSGSGSEANVTSVFGYFKIGHAAVADTIEDSAITWDIVDDTAEKAGLSDDFVSNQADVQGWITSAAYIIAGENGGELISKQEIPEIDLRINKGISVSADLNTSSATGGYAKFVFGIDAADVATDGADTLAAGINFKDGKYYLTIWEGSAIKAEREITLGQGQIRITYGQSTISATYAGATVSADVENTPFGLFAYAASAGAQNVQMDNLYIRIAEDYIQNPAKSAAVNFDGMTSLDDLDEGTWHTGSVSAPDYTDGGLYVKDGKLSFFNASDGTMFTSAEKFQNFVLQFDIPYIEREGQEDEDGNLTRAVSTWLGITFGMENMDTMFSAQGQKMIYLGPGTIDLNNAQFDGGSTRVWAPKNLWETDLNGKTITIRLTARDNSLSLAYRIVEDEDISVLDTPKAVISEIDTYGHIGIQCTANGNFDIDNLVLINTDETENYTLTQKTLSETKITATVGEKVTGSIDLGDMTNKSAVFTPVDREGFKLNADGTYEYTAPAAKPEEAIEFSYDVTIDDWNLDGWYSPVGNASVYTVTGKVVVEVNEVTLSEIVVTPPTKTQYTVGESLDLSGMAVKAKMSDGTETALAAADYTVDASKFDCEKAGTYEIKVTYGSKTATFNVTVSEKTEAGCSSSVSVAGGAVLAVMMLGTAASVVAVRKKKD